MSTLEAFLVVLLATVASPLPERYYELQGGVDEESMNTPRLVITSPATLPQESTATDVPAFRRKRQVGPWGFRQPVAPYWPFGSPNPWGQSQNLGGQMGGSGWDQMQPGLYPQYNPGGMAPGGMVPGGMMPGGMVPGGMAPGGMVPGGMMPGGMLPGGMVPGGMMPNYPVNFQVIPSVGSGVEPVTTTAAASTTAAAASKKTEATKA